MVKDRIISLELVEGESGRGYENVLWATRLSRINVLGYKIFIYAFVYHVHEIITALESACIVGGLLVTATC